jgi:hypothetical protein
MKIGLIFRHCHVNGPGTSDPWKLCLDLIGFLAVLIIFTTAFVVGAILSLACQQNRES